MLKSDFNIFFWFGLNIVGVFEKAFRVLFIDTTFHTILAAIVSIKNIYYNSRLWIIKLDNFMQACSCIVNLIYNII